MTLEAAPRVRYARERGGLAHGADVIPNDPDAVLRAAIERHLAASEAALPMIDGLWAQANGAIGGDARRAELADSQKALRAALDALTQPREP